jgi:peptidoglycan/xylan/chitin deacetylase (PgdA/CDA1 family)
VLRRVRSGASVFCFHNVVPSRDSGLGDASLHLDVGRFEQLVRWIGSAYDVVPLSEVLQGVREGGTLRGLAALTFDDTYRGAVEHALPILRGLGVPSTLFVVPSAARNPRPFWWDRLAARGALSDRNRDVCLREHRGRSDDVLASFNGSEPGSEPHLPSTMLPASWAEIRRAATGVDVVAIGSHTATHPNLTALGDDQIFEEMKASRDEIALELGVAPDVVSYPYGLHDQRVLSQARRAGYRSGLTLRAGLVRSWQDVLALPRLNVPAGIGVEALECGAVGLRPPRRS